MRKVTIISLIMPIIIGFSSPASAIQDTLAKVKQKGVLVAGVKDSLPPFGYVDEQTRQIVGYDVDFVKAIADKLGVKLETQGCHISKPHAAINRGKHRYYRGHHDQNP